ncbi:MAG: FxsB family cyclophane-forming radical SAM/SPASM peptide maturase [Trebonia sp.]|jgi:uncharacterized protein
MPTPISQYVLKVHSRCDLACDHCYVYEHADQSWRGKPMAISQDTVGMAARRIAEHATAHGLAKVHVVLHGGEPLLLAKERMRELLRTLISDISPAAAIKISVQSNGVRLDEQWCELFSEYGVRVGISLDGDEAANDRHRKFANGHSSYSRVADALALLRQPQYRHLYAGILCTIDLANDPVAVYEALVAHRPPNLDLLLPHATWEHPPYRPVGSESPYADWLTQVYRLWNRDGQRIPIRMFDSLLSAVRGGPSLTEAIGLNPADLLVVETDGSWEQPDSMKTTFDGAAATGMSVFHHSVDEAAAHPAVAARQQGLAALCATCRECPVVGVCGGGLYAHRYRPVTGSGNQRTPHGGLAAFDNPSVFCPDLKVLIGDVMAEARTSVVAVPTAAVSEAAGTSRVRVPSPSRPAHALPTGAFDLLAAGPGDPAGLAALAEMRLSQTRALVAMMALADDAGRQADLRLAAAEGWALLSALDADYPEAVRPVFAHPYTSAWAVRCLRRPVAADAALDRAHLAGLAAAAAMRAGIPAELPLPVRAGMVHLPTIGAIAVAAKPGCTEVVTVAPGRRPAARGGGRWLGGRYLTAAPFSRLALEDLDPFRDCQQWPAAARLTVPEWRAWRIGLAAAGTYLAGTVPLYADALGAGLRAVVPLFPGTAGSRGATARQAFGAVAIALPARPPGNAGPFLYPSRLADLLMHEFQHVKLNALTELGSLFDPQYAARLRVPWRADRRPIEGVMHGAYGYLALAHLRRAEGRDGPDEYPRYRSWVCEAAAALLATGALTPYGERFAAGMASAAKADNRITVS